MDCTKWAVWLIHCNISIFSLTRSCRNCTRQINEVDEPKPAAIQLPFMPLATMVSFMPRFTFGMVYLLWVVIYAHLYANSTVGRTEPEDISRLVIVTVLVKFYSSVWYLKLVDDIFSAINVSKLPFPLV